MSNSSFESTGGLRPLVHKIPACGALEEGVHDFGPGHTWELRTALGEAPYEVPERLAGFLGARAQVL
jgi:hypothetical protein